jgi:IclR family KDG regulon transcriptional repressor
LEKTVVKALKALEVLCRADEPVGVTRLARALALNKSNAHRILGTLLALGYVRRDGAAGYAPSLKLWELGASVRVHNDLGRIAKPYLPELSARTGETVLVAVLDGCDSLYLEKQESAHPVRIAATVGQRLPGYCSATGRVLLAHAADSERLIPTIKFVRHAVNTITSAKELRQALLKVRQQGFALSVEEYMAGVCGLAVPIRGSNGDVTAALGLTALKLGLTEARIKRLVAALHDTAEKIGYDAGYRPPASEAQASPAPPRLVSTAGRRSSRPGPSSRPGS